MNPDELGIVTTIISKDEEDLPKIDILDSVAATLFSESIHTCK